MEENLFSVKKFCAPEGEHGARLTRERLSEIAPPEATTQELLLLVRGDLAAFRFQHPLASGDPIFLQVEGRLAAAIRRLAQ